MAIEERAPKTADEEILGTKRRSVKQVRTEEERLDRITGELRIGFSKLREIGPAVSMFGSARVPEDHPDYERARETARMLGAHGFSIITGGGPGIMEACNRGAQDAKAISIGLNIELPFEQAPNPYQDIELNFHYFFTRKLLFVRYATGFVVFPGGYGTLDELFEALVLEQTDKITDFPIVLVGKEFWTPMVEWVRTRLVDDGLIGEKDTELLTVTDDPEVVCETLAACQAMQEEALSSY